MPRYTGTTAQRGLGSGHQQERQRALASLQDGDPCARCALRGIEHPMFRWAVTRQPSGRYTSALLDLDDFPGRAYGGPQVKRLSWRACNRRDGQAKTAALLRARGGPTARQVAAARIRQWYAAGPGNR